MSAGHGAAKIYKVLLDFFIRATSDKFSYGFCVFLRATEGLIKVEKLGKIII